MYILDTNVFITFSHYYPSTFPSFWDRINNLIVQEKIFSVKEVHRELENQCSSGHLEKWINENRKIFRKPIPEELLIVSNIFRHKHNMSLVRKNSLLKGLPVADPFIIAAGKHYDAYVVTEESFKPGSSKIPNICSQFEVKCIKLEQLLKIEKIKI